MALPGDPTGEHTRVAWEPCPEELRSDLEIGQTVTGKVLRCRLITVMGGTTWRVKTALTVLPEG